jgi:glycosyltransferase involved in cell wall biosynthesis
MKVAALVPYQAGFCSGQRFRIELWSRHLRQRGIAIDLYPFANEALTDVLYHRGRYLGKGVRMIRCFTDQLRRILGAPRPDLVYIYREAALLGPPVIERLTRRWKAPIVYDLDEPLFLPYDSPRNHGFECLRWASKVHSLFRMSNHVLAVNRVIGDYAARYARQVSIVPMAVDTDRYRPAPTPPAASPIRIAWTGTRTTQPNLGLIAGTLRRLNRSPAVGLRVLGDEPMSLPGVDVEFIPWEYAQEVPRLWDCHIGVVPVKSSVWTPWKFYFKLIQFMSLGLPVVATPVGSNREIIQDGVNGFLADTEDQWADRLLALVDDPALRRSMGEAARQTAETSFGLGAQNDQVESILKGC